MTDAIRTCVDNAERRFS